ncbi:dipeptidyl aminopeptidase/acylaminoacyl peptidase [Brachybacterium faecium DSM 4810]|uniref:Dipeptidyl aminopeptidase/acylaminoacyl peptidase n=1 Tax=Brachybacterium faecium (strain ATCC 43885 / DSM 4810 / JCM 11609 / LMG 19847 / NBRC 14762 / NCIMB 9860 / 6-10) TaxID=446465 RepID=C7MFM2_BRAFD|nr:alpha/beta fold hydrolase [Brachybacterium faecium]ACU86239.1 dipeptidyl aminopeptidase/acylaminoacyl peptidase [Brachybacterium faecium DSM 4810]HJG53162.1 prolyl oligopeptidase family serine peptidase [Brachybacterium faecium]
MTSSPATTAPQPSESFTDFSDIDGFLRLPRLASVATGAGGRVIAAISEADGPGAKLVSALWELDPSGEAPARRLTVSEKGESAPRLAPDGSVLFTSSRPDPQGGTYEDKPALWRLPTTGEARLLAAAPGGLSLLAVVEDGTMLATTEVLPGSTLEDDAERRTARKDAKQTTIWHTGMPIRLWDRELGDAERHLVLISPAGELTDLTPAAGTVPLYAASADLSPDGSTVATSWARRVRGGETRSDVVLVDTATGARSTLLSADDEVQYGSPSFSPDGTRLAVLRSTLSTPHDTSYTRLEIRRLDEVLRRTGTAGTADDAVDADAADSADSTESAESAAPVVAELGDLTLTDLEWADATTLLVAGDLHSSGAVLAVDATTGETRTVADGGVFSSLTAGEDGALFALRSDVATPPRPVRIDAADPEGTAAVTELAAPGAVGALPGTLEWVEADLDGITVGGWLCAPASATPAEPAPVMLWIHGGPHSSYNAWSWRWCPWLAVERGYAVLMPDPAMSTGYGDTGLNRGWPRRPDVVFHECETLFDQILERPELDGTRTALLGASFGGFMTNWIAGRSDRFDAIVTHAGLWALPQQHRTTDAAASKMRVHQHEDVAPDWYRAFSPHHEVEAITTPMLVTHGNRDYRVPVSEALRLWWDLVSAWDGEPEDMPHRFLQLTSENHWVLTPSNALAWNQAVLAFCDQHVLGAAPVPEVLPW